MFLMSYNCRGFNNAKVPYINSLLERCDVLFLQEHWLLNNGLQRMEGTFEKHHVFGISGVIIDKLLLGRPYGGVAILINKNIQCIATSIYCDSKRICAVLCDFNDYTVLFLSIYMPCDEICHHDEYNYVLSQITSLLFIKVR